MAIPTADKLKWYYPLKINTADGQVSAVLTSDGTNSTLAIQCSSLTQADDYWNGAIGRFEGDTPTVALRGIYFHVKDFVAVDDELQLAKVLPATPAVNDEFKLFFGGNWRTTDEIPGMDITTPTNVTGVVIDNAGFANGVGSGTLYYDLSDDSLSWKAPGDSGAGELVDVSAGDGVYELFSASREKFLIVTVTYASLPGSDQNDVLALTNPVGEVIPDFEGYETAGSGKTRYHLAVIKNEDGTDTMNDVRAYIKAAEGDGVTTTLADAVTIAADNFDLTDGSSFPERSFWMKNTTKDDCRYIFFRSGNTCYSADATGGLRGFTAQAWDATDDVEVLPEMDLGLDAPSTLQFENPADEETAPSGVTFSAPDTYDDGLLIGALADTDIYGIWIRETIVQGVYSRDNFANDIIIEWS